ncbi:DUF4268 domain-containing protein [Brucella sp. 21LCYQ03]|nr:DUF4268 domain-containing protein [Brucella sp. 21LCYQ03]
MYRIENNRLVAVPTTTLADLDLGERGHLQEWLAENPNSLGEELLIIQKEFSAFSGTNERLDLLALDINGNLVVIENKRDDSGRDVTWQALKYTAYVSGMTKSEILRVYQHYLATCSTNENNTPEDAEKNICEFLGKETIEEAELNVGNRQRIILVATKFRTEVTSTVLWLNSRGIDARCIRVTPFKHNTDIFVDIEQIIPVPEAKHYMVGILSKENEETGQKTAATELQRLRYSFWTQMLESFRRRGITRFDRISPSRDHWLSSRFGVRGCTFTAIFALGQIRVELNLSRFAKEENKWLFDKLYEHREGFDQAFGDRLTWMRLDDRIASRVCYSKTVDARNRNDWPLMIDWLGDHIKKLETTFSNQMLILKDQLPNEFGDEEIESIEDEDDKSDVG